MALTEYQPVGNASDVTNVNPYAPEAWNLQNMIAQSMMGAGVMDPMTAMNQFLKGGAGTGLMEMAMGASSPYAQATSAQAMALAPQAVQAALDPYIQSRAFYGSGAVSAATKAAGDVWLSAQEKALGAQTGLASNLLTSGLGALSQAYGQGMGLFGQTLSGIAQQGANEFWQPTWTEQNTALGNIMQLLMGGADLASGLTSIFTGRR